MGHLLLWLASLCALLADAREARALENGLARTPPMGWLAWERFTCETDCERYPDACVSARLIRRQADRLFEDGWLAAGYEYVNIDDCWSERERDAQSGRLRADERRFPAARPASEGAIAELAEYVHKHDGLKLGIYGDCGSRTCGGYPGQLRNDNSSAFEPRDWRERTHFQLDAQTFADWRVDSLKFDGCFVDPLGAERVCPMMASALANTKRPILLVCEWPFYMMYAHREANWTLAAQSCNAWRYFDDIEDSWLSVLNTIDHTIRHQDTMVKYHGPGHWFDPDQLVVGNFGLSVGQARAQMALWCVWSAPLFVSTDLGSIGPEFASILLNRHLIEVDQDRLGVLGLLSGQSADGQLQAFVKPVEPISARTGCPSFVLVYLNRRTLGNRQLANFKLANLLLGAPVRQAAKNQAAAREFERARAATQGPELGQLLAGSGSGSGAPVAPAPTSAPGEQPDVRPAACLELLRRAAKFDASEAATAGAASARPAGPEFALTDLFENGASLGSLGAHENLELLVEPSSVRVVKLVERAAQ